MNVPLVDLKSQFESLRDDIFPAMEAIMHDGRFILGREVEEFEACFADYCEARHCVGVASGTDALHLALRAIGVGPGDEVITVGNSFVATPFAIVHTGASPVFVDVDPNDYTIDVNLIESAISAKTKAIVPVHLYGQPARMDAMMDIARRHGLRIVEDACQAHGARYGDARVGTIGDAGCFSFYPGKNLGAYGDGGAIVTNDDAIASQIRQLRNYGQVSKNVHAMVGYNSRLDTLQAAVLLAKLPHLDQWNDRRRKVAELYDRLLQDTPLLLPTERLEVSHVFHLYVVRAPDRDTLVEKLRERGVFAGVHYPTPLNQMPPFAGARTCPEGLPVCCEISKEILSLPVFPEMTNAQVEYVSAALRGILQRPSPAAAQLPR